MSRQLVELAVLATAGEIHRIEDRINTLVTVLQYLAPLLGGLVLTYTAMFAYIGRKIKSNADKLGVIQKQTNGAIEDIRQQVTEVHSATVTSIPPEHEPLGKQVSEVHDATIASDTAGGGSPAAEPPATE